MSDAAGVAELTQMLSAKLEELDLHDPTLRDALARAKADLAALRFHLLPGQRVPLVALMGGTGTGKSTLVNRLVGATVSATSYRRTFTAGPIAVVGHPHAIPREWLGVEHTAATELPARGSPEVLVIVTPPPGDARINVLIDTPDLDGDTPAHHAAADRVFRWADGIVFVVTPEKYQMTELLPYYRLARRYGLLVWFVMNKTERAEAVEDYRRQLAERDWSDARLFAIERDDAAFTAAPPMTLAALRTALTEPRSVTPQPDGLRNRRSDAVSRLTDQVIAPLRETAQQVQRLTGALRAMEQPMPNLDVNPLTEALRVRLQQRSILYLLGPQRVWDRVRQLPGLMLRLPRSVWNAARGDKVGLPEPDAVATTELRTPDFAAALHDQFAVVQSRIEDVLRSDGAVGRWMDDEMRAFTQARIDPADAAHIADEEVEQLRQWLQKRWDANPRDTLLVMKLLSYLPGGQRITKAVEAAPYLLLIIFALHPGHLLHEVVFGVGYAAVASIMERLSNEVSQQTRATNRRIADRFTELAHRQIEQTCSWLAKQSVSPERLRGLEALRDRLAEF